MIAVFVDGPRMGEIMELPRFEDVIRTYVKHPITWPMTRTPTEEELRQPALTEVVYRCIGHSFVGPDTHYYKAI
jgi:hypothetical protein